MFEIMPLEKRVATPFSLNFYEAVQHMRRTIDAGITTVRDAGGADAGVKQAVKVMAHAQGTEGIQNAIQTGIHSIEHGIFLDDETIRMMCGEGTFLVPTLLAPPIAVVEIGEATGAMPEYGLRKAKEVI